MSASNASTYIVGWTAIDGSKSSSVELPEPKSLASVVQRFAPKSTHMHTMLSMNTWTENTTSCCTSFHSTLRLVLVSCSAQASPGALGLMFGAAYFRYDFLEILLVL